MKNYLKTGGRVLFDYAMSLVVFVIFVYVFMSVTKDNFGKWLPLYCALIFLFLFYILYNEMKTLGIKEKKPQYELNPYPLKGLVYGAIGMVPVALIAGILALLNFEDKYVDRIIHLAINTLLGPMYFVIRWFHEAVVGYAAAILLVPVLTMLGYLAGYHGIQITEKLKKKKVVEQKAFKKSPWNPTSGSVKKTGKKKDGSKKASGRE
jgi:hypothetical protein